MADQQITLQQLENRLAGFGNIPIATYLNRPEDSSTDNHEDSSSRTCSFCCEDPLDFRVFQRGHLLCGPCIGRLVQKGTSDVYFPANRCGHEILIDDVKDILDPKVVEAYTARQEESLVPILDRRFCSTPTCSKLLHPDLFSLRVELIEQAECVSCEASTCWCCCGPVRSGEHECKANWLDEASVKHVLADGTVKQCPKCWVLAEHWDACNHTLLLHLSGELPLQKQLPQWNGHEVDEDGYYADGFHKDTGLDAEGYDRRGYNLSGLNRAGNSLPPREEVDDDQGGQNEWDLDEQEEQHPDQHDVNPAMDEWHQNWMPVANEIDWDALSECAQADHEAAQMELNMAQGLFDGAVNDGVQDHHRDEDTEEEEKHLGEQPDATGIEAAEDDGMNGIGGDNAQGDTVTDDVDDIDLDLQSLLMDSLVIQPQNPQAANVLGLDGEVEPHDQW